MCDVSVYAAARTAMEKSAGRPEGDADTNLAILLGIAERLGYVHDRHHRVLDFGCGIGDTVGLLLGHGFDAYGVDVGEWWGKDFESYWHGGERPSAALCARLSTTTESAYRLPYPDSHFDLIISSQVFEHVFNYEAVLRELGRVMKPGAISIHVFPGPGTPFEPHLFVPLTPLAKYSIWLAIWAALRRRHKPTWRAEFAFLRDSMRSNNYPFRFQLKRFARNAGVKLSFHEYDYIAVARGRPQKLIDVGRRLGIEWAARRMARTMCQRAMAISKEIARDG
jgi:SAM-dependent methyltransferase